MHQSLLLPSLSSGSRAANLNTPPFGHVVGSRPCAAQLPLWSRGGLATPRRSASALVTCPDASRCCRWRRSHFDEAVDDEVVCVPLQAAQKYSVKTHGKTSDDARLNMGPPGERICHTSTERTEDFGWIVDLSWHGMQRGESAAVTTEEKKKENKV